MKTRYKSYIDYGMSEQKANDLKRKCQVLNADERDSLLKCCKSSNESIAYEILYSLIYNVSYDKLIFSTEVPISKVDFYAYRRKALFLFNEKLNK